MFSLQWIASGQHGRVGLLVQNHVVQELNRKPEQLFKMAKMVGKNAIHKKILIEGNAILIHVQEQHHRVQIHVGTKKLCVTTQIGLIGGKVSQSILYCYIIYCEIFIIMCYEKIILSFLFI